MNDAQHLANRSRRRFLVFSGLAISSLALSIIAYPRLKQFKIARLSTGHRPGTQNGSTIDEKAINTVVIFVGALFGQRLQPPDKLELEERLKYAAEADSGWMDEYSWLGNHIIRKVEDLSLPAPENCSSDELAQLVAGVLGSPPSSKLSKLLAFVSEEERFRRRMMTSTTRHLVRIYRRSGVQWRRRGYKSWPGVPGDPLSYMTHGPDYRW